MALPQCVLGAWALISSAYGFISNINSLLSFYFLVRGIGRISNHRLNCPFDLEFEEKYIYIKFNNGFHILLHPCL